MKDTNYLGPFFAESGFVGDSANGKDASVLGICHEAESISPDGHAAHLRPRVKHRVVPEVSMMRIR